MEIIVNTAIPVRLDRYLRRLYSGLTQGLMEKSLRKSYIKVNQQKALANQRLVSGDVITIKEKYLPPDSLQIDNNSSSKTTFTSPHIASLAGKILGNYKIYEDNNLLVINKPTNLATQGGSKITLSVDDALQYINHRNNSIDHDNKWRLVHRLDYATSGVLLIAKNYLTGYKLTKAFKDKILAKTYYAVVYGKPIQSQGIIKSFIESGDNKPLSKATYDRRMEKTYREPYQRVHEDTSTKAERKCIGQVEFRKKSNKEAITEYKVIVTTDNFSFLQMKPKTGRMHQLRIHALELGCPIIGDKKYNKSENVKSKHMLLHAAHLIIPQEVFGTKLELSAPLPDYFYFTPDFTAQLQTIQKL